MSNKQMNARELIESQGRAPILGWLEGRKIDLRTTDVRKTFARIRKAQALQSKR